MFHLDAGTEARRWHVHVPSELSPSQPNSTQASPSRGTPQGTPRPGVSTPLSGGGTAVAAGPVSSPGHIWIGQTRASVLQLKPGAVAEVPLQVAFPSH